MFEIPKFNINIKQLPSLLVYITSVQTESRAAPEPP